MRTAIKKRPAAQPKHEKRLAKEMQAVREKPIVKERPLVKEKPVQEIPENMGLCITCNEAPTCVYAKNAKRPVLFCEMFDDSSTPAETTTPAETVTIEEVEIPQVQSAPEKCEPSNLKGLCVNCDNREICTFPKPEGGVWHCEEYR